MLLVLLEAYLLAIPGLDHDTFRRIQIEVREAASGSSRCRGGRRGTMKKHRRGRRYAYERTALYVVGGRWEASRG